MVFIRLIAIMLAAAGPERSISGATDCPAMVSDVIMIPRMLSYQGRLADSSGVAVPDTLYRLTFSLYADSVGGSPIWQERQSIRTRAGLFSTLLGAATPIGAMPNHGRVYLAMAVADGPELSPRLQLASAAYAFKADTANYAFASPTSGENSWVRGVPDSVLFTVKELGIARGGAGNFLYEGRHTHTNLGAACTTGANGEDSRYCTVAGGFGNAAAGDYSAVSGGLENIAADPYSTVGGGGNNRADGEYATIAGGQGNSALAGTTAVGGGKFNLAGGMNATIAGGKYNTATGYCSAVGGGVDNVSEGVYATVAGGSGNTARGDFSNVGGGFGNVATGHAGTVPGGSRNAARGFASFAAGNRALANHAGSFAWGDSAADETESLYTTGTNQFRARARGGVWFFSDAEMRSGVYLAPGANSWTAPGDRACLAGEAQSVDRESLLQALARLRVREYRLKGQNGAVRHIGPDAEEFYERFGYGENRTGINMADMDGVLLAAVQALYEENRRLSQRLTELECEAVRR